MKKLFVLIFLLCSFFQKNSSCKQQELLLDSQRFYDEIGELKRQYELCKLGCVMGFVGAGAVLSTCIDEYCYNQYVATECDKIRPKCSETFFAITIGGLSTWFVISCCWEMLTIYKKIELLKEQANKQFLIEMLGKIKIAESRKRQ